MPLPQATLLIPSPGSDSDDCLPPASVTGTARDTEVLKVLDVRGVNLLFNNGYSLAFCNLSSHLRNPSGISWDPRPQDGRSGLSLAQTAMDLGDPCFPGHLCLSPAPNPEWQASLGKPPLCCLFRSWARV